MQQVQVVYIAKVYGVSHFYPINSVTDSIAVYVISVYNYYVFEFIVYIVQLNALIYDI